MGNLIGKWVKIITVLLIVLLCTWEANDSFSRRDNDSGFFMSLAAISFSITAIALFFHKKKPKAKAQIEEEDITVSGKSIISMLVTIIILCFALFQIFIRIDEYFDKRAEIEQKVKDGIENHQRWIDDMTYNLDNLSEYHYLEMTYLNENSHYSIFSKVIDVKDGNVNLAKFYMNLYDHIAPSPYSLQKNYTADNQKDTITLTLEELKKTISYTSEDSLSKQGIHYFIKDTYYINGPYLFEQNHATHSRNDTTYFTFENLNKKAILKDIINISGNFKWHNSLPMNVNGYQRNSHGTEQEFVLKATNVNLTEEYKFQLHFEDSVKNKHVFLVTKKSQKQPYIYRSKRIFDK